jgi:hypothetical protein
MKAWSLARSGSGDLPDPDLHFLGVLGIKIIVFKPIIITDKDPHHERGMVMPGPQDEWCREETG